MRIIKVLETIELHPLVEADAEEIFNTIHAERDYLGKWLPFVHHTHAIKFTQAFVTSVVNAPTEKWEPTFTIRHNGTFIGIIGFTSTDRQNCKTEIGYWLSENYQGKGWVTSSVKRLCEYAFSELGMYRIQIKCAVGNTKSNAIPKRLNFTFEGIERAGEQFADGSFVDIEVYSLLKDEWTIDS